MLKGFGEFVNESRRVGFRETVSIPGVGDLVAKFDTGNGSRACSLTHDWSELSDGGDSIRWRLGGLEFLSRVVGTSDTEVGHTVESRPIIELDLVFAGRLYHKVPVSLVDRSGKSTKFLANRDFMERVGCTVSPFETFIASRFDGDYSADLAKLDPHAGILFKGQSKEVPDFSKARSYK